MMLLRMSNTSEVKEDEEDNREEDNDEEYVKRSHRVHRERVLLGEKKYAEKILEETKKELMTRKRNNNEMEKEDVMKKDTRTMTSGRVYSKILLSKTKSLYDMHMGAENMGPFLYQL